MKNSLTFIEFFDMISPTEQQLVSRFLLESDEDKKTLDQTFDMLLQQFHKSHWKIITGDIKEKLRKAQNEGDMQEVAHIISQFQEMKKRLQERSILWHT
jgi:hypothetical protein